MSNSVDNSLNLYMFHQGFALKQFIAEGYISANEMAKVLGVSKAAIYGLFGAEKLEKRYVDILVKNKLKIDGVTTIPDKSNIDNTEIVGLSLQKGESKPQTAIPETHSDMMNLMRETIEALRGENAIQKKYIALLEARMK